MLLVVALVATPCKWETLLATPSKQVGNGRSLIGLALAILPSSAYVTHCGPTLRYATRRQHCVTQWHPAAPWGVGIRPRRRRHKPRRLMRGDSMAGASNEGATSSRSVVVPKASAPDRCCGGTVPGGWKSSEEGEWGRVGTGLPAGDGAHRGVAWQKAQRGDWMFSNNADYNKQITSFERR